MRDSFMPVTSAAATLPSVSSRSRRVVAKVGADSSTIKAGSYSAMRRISDGRNAARRHTSAPALIPNTSCAPLSRIERVEVLDLPGHAVVAAARTAEAADRAGRAGTP